VVPAFNEARVLPTTLPRILEVASDFGDCEVIVVDDGSTDETLRIAGEILDAYPRGELIWHPHNRGKGAAVRSGISRARGRNVVFVDADLAPDLETGLRRAVVELERAPVAVASRAVDGAVVIGATALRRALGLGFRALRKAVVNVEVADTQCGLKAFRAGPAKVLFHYSTSNGFVFDVELMIAARSLGLHVSEFPIKWTAVEPSGVRPLRDSVRMAAELMKLRFLPGRPPPVVCVRIPLPKEKRPDLETVMTSLRHGDLVVESEDRIAVFLFCAPREAGTSVATRLSESIGITSLEVTSVSAFEAASYLKQAFTSDDSDTRSLFV
jgi:hypothetical protein